MKKLLRVAACVGFILFLSACATIAPSGATAPASLTFIDRALDRLLPPDWDGNAKLEERGQYLTLVIEAGRLHRNATTGRWSWAWLEYQRIVNVPLFAGLPYRQEGKVTLGQRP